MIKPDMIPLEVKLRLRNVLSDGETNEAVALAAALNAWSGMAVNDGCPVWHACPHIILPLPQEARDE